MTRMITYDGLRGWLLIIIACNHLWGEFVSDFTRAPFGFVSAAEAFVFLSGFVAYFVYQRLDHSPFKQTKKILFRTGTIYLFHLFAIAITFLFVTLFPFANDMWQNFFLAGNFFKSPNEFFLAAALLLEHPGYHDILIMYLFSMLFLPLAMIALRRHYWLLVLVVSTSCWLFAPVVELSTLQPLYQTLFPTLSMQLSYFDPMAWQLYFYMGVLLSYAKYQRQVTFNFNQTVTWFIFGLAILFLVARHGPYQWFTPWIENSGLAPIGMIINLLVLSYIFKCWMTHYPYLFTLKYPVFLGQHALPVFSFHTIVVYFLLPLSHPAITQYWYWDLTACVVFVALLYIPAALDECYRRYKYNEFKHTPTLTLKNACKNESESLQ